MPAESGVENVRQASRLAARVIAHGGFELFSQSRHGFEAFDQIVFVCRDGHDLYNIGLSLLQKQGKLDDLFSFHGNAGMAAMTRPIRRFGSARSFGRSRDADPLYPHHEDEQGKGYARKRVLLGHGYRLCAGV